MNAASRVIFTAQHARQIYAARYPGLNEKSLLIPNGYDETRLPIRTGKRKSSGSPLTILHSGSLQPKGRNPESFFEALQKLKARGKISASQVKIVFRGCGYKERYRSLAEALSVSDLVALEDRVSYAEAIDEMVNADALLVFQGSAYNQAVPAKIYEYFFAGKPILGIVDKRGETKRVLDDVGISETASIDDASEIANQLTQLMATLGAQSPFLPDPAAIPQYSRRNQTRKLASVLEEVIYSAGRPYP